MKRFFIVTGTVTYAIRGRDLLRRNGINSDVNKISGASYGCGYAIEIKSDVDRAVSLLKENGIRILDVTSM